MLKSSEIDTMLLKFPGGNAPSIRLLQFGPVIALV